VNNRRYTYVWKVYSSIAYGRPTRLKKTFSFLAALFLMSIVVGASSLEVYAWGNGRSTSKNYPYYGIHDIIADIAYQRLKSYNATIAKWITDYYNSSSGSKWGDYAYSFNRGPDNWLSYTDDPDSYYQDYNNHFYEANTARRGAPARAKTLYNWVVANLTMWIRAGMRPKSNEEHKAAYAAGLLTHYIADLSQYGHTDYTEQDHTHPSYDPEDATYHSYYESESISDTFIDRLTADLEAYPEPAVLMVENVSYAAVKLAGQVRGGVNGSSVSYVDKNGVNRSVGLDYREMLTRFVRNYDSGESYLGARGCDFSLYNMSLRNIESAVETLVNLFYSAYHDAEEVMKPSSFIVNGLSVKPSEALVNQTTTISVNVTNRGGTKETHAVLLVIEGVVETSMDVTLSLGESTRVNFEVIRDTPATYDFDVAGLSGTFVVRMPKPAEFVVSNLTIKPAEVTVGNPVAIQFKVTNTGEVQDTYEATLVINNSTETTRDMVLGPGMWSLVNFTVTKNAAGTYNVNAQGQSGTFLVRDVFPIWLLYVGFVGIVIAFSSVMMMTRKRGRRRKRFKNVKK